MKKRLTILFVILMVLVTSIFSLSMTSFGASATGEGIYNKIVFDGIEDGTELPRNTVGQYDLDNPFVVSLQRYTTMGKVFIYNDGTDSYARIIRTSTSTTNAYVRLNLNFAETKPAGTTLKIKVVFRISEGFTILEKTKDYAYGACGVFFGGGEHIKLVPLAPKEVPTDAPAGTTLEQLQAEHYAEYTTWHTVEGEITSENAAELFYISNYSAKDHYVDIKEISIHEHTFTTYTPNNDATCMANGTESASCEECGYVDTREIPDSKLDHEFVNYTPNNDATCTANGTETALCNILGCTATDDREIPNSKLDHTFATYTPNNDATCTANGTETSTCTGCTETDTREIADSKLDHTFVDGVCTCGEVEPKGGCGAVIGATSAILSVVLLAGATIVLKKKD